MASNIELWLVENKHRISHFRPRKWCGVCLLLAYDRTQRVPYIDGQPLIEDNEENTKLIHHICGRAIIEERFASIRGSNNY